MQGSETAVLYIH